MFIPEVRQIQTKIELNNRFEKQMERILISLSLLLCLGCCCPFDSQNMPSALSCVQQIVCLDGTQLGSSEVLVQNCNKKWYYGSSEQSIAELTEVSHSSASFVGLNKLASRLVVTQSFALIAFNSTLAYHYPLGSSSYNYTLSPSSSFTSLSLLKLANGTRKALFLLPSAVEIFNFDSTNIISSREQISLTSPSAIDCFDDRKHCLVGSQDGTLTLLDAEKNSIAGQIATGGGSGIVLIESQALARANSFKIYVGYADGRISQFLVDANRDIQLERSTTYFSGEQLYSMASIASNTYFILTDTAGNISQIDLSTGQLLDSINIADYLTDKTNKAMSILTDSDTSYYIYNTLNSLIFKVDVDPASNIDHIVLSCFDLHYYDSQQQQCEACSDECATCSPLSGLCLSCVGSYFNKEGECFSCFYNSEGLTDHFQECFSSTEQTVMETSQTAAQFLSVVVSNFAVVMNLCGLLFLFLKLINNWNLLCLYFFPAIQLPFFLENILQTLFSNFNSSVLKVAGIELNLSLHTKSKFVNSPKVAVMNLNSDFLEMNSEPIILFVYSVILTVTVYKFINFILAKVNISIFQQNIVISIMEEFVGCFTVSVLPLYFLFARANFNSPQERINLMLYYTLFGFVLMVPFGFLIFDHEYKVIRNNKVHNNDENLIAESVNLGLTKRIKAWREDDSKQNFYYALFSFTTAILSVHPNPQVFIFGVGAVNLLCLVNAFTVKQRRVNVIIQKLSFFIFHAGYSSLYYLQDGRIKLRIAIFLVVLIVFIAVHELLLTLYKKVYFLYILIKGKLDKESKVQTFFRDNQAKRVNKNRVHPIELPLRANTRIIKKEMELNFKNFQVTVVREVEPFIVPKTVRDVNIKAKRDQSAKNVGEGKRNQTSNPHSKASGETKSELSRKKKKGKVQ